MYVYYWKEGPPSNELIDPELDRRSGKMFLEKLKQILKKLKPPASSLIIATLHPWGHSFPPQMDRCIVQIQNWPLNFHFHRLGN